MLDGRTKYWLSLYGICVLLLIIVPYAINHTLLNRPPCFTQGKEIGEATKIGLAIYGDMIEFYVALPATIIAAFGGLLGKLDHDSPGARVVVTLCTVGASVSAFCLYYTSVFRVKTLEVVALRCGEVIYDVLDSIVALVHYSLLVSLSFLFCSLIYFFNRRSSRCHVGSPGSS